MRFELNTYYIIYGFSNNKFVKIFKSLLIYFYWLNVKSIIEFNSLTNSIKKFNISYSTCSYLGLSNKDNIFIKESISF